MTVNSIASLANTNASLQSSKILNEKGKFEQLLNKVYGEQKNFQANISSSQLSNGKLNGDYSTGFEGTYKLSSDKNAKPLGFAANQKLHSEKENTIDKTSKLYESCLEMENYFVKIMINQMRKTVVKAGNENDFATKMYEDMLYDEYAVSMTKNAGFGLADQMYLQLSNGGLNVEA